MAARAFQLRTCCAATGHTDLDCRGIFEGGCLRGLAPELFNVRMETSQGVIVIEIHRDWAPHGAARFYNLVRAGYYDQVRFHRIRKGKVTLTVTDANGKTIRTFATKAGLNRVALPLIDFGQQFGGGRGANNPPIAPGDYTVTLQTGGKQFTQTARVFAAKVE